MYVQLLGFGWKWQRSFQLKKKKKSWRKLCKVRLEFNKILKYIYRLMVSLGVLLVQISNAKQNIQNMCSELNGRRFGLTDKLPVPGSPFVII